ncbi:hypothetical protein FALBO_1974 [Fusarium albosuccineum]|uniref:Fungal N-terminal domain-containing protein n=1 Tax=Fusarium albosuccineum TaxID=1237068 RepID=A0A8H4PLS0_9HYPO|nr:hypothetical protein FALBO_1974 [Fusarium albosuccineum]
MAEPVGITGTAVGIVSLGLQLYGGISDYLDAVKGRDEDLRHAKKHAKTLQASLRAIDDTIKNVKCDSTVAKDAAEECKSSCETELKALDTLLKDLQGPAIAPVDRIDQAKSSLRKWTYPFNKRDIAKLENRLSSTNGVLQTALMTLQMSISNITTDAMSGLQRAVETIQATAVDNNRTAMAQFEVLNRVNENSARVNQEVQFISQEALVRQDARLDEICTYLQAATGPDRQIAQLVSSQQDLKKVCDTMLNLLRHQEPESTVLGTQVTSFQRSGSAATQPFCRCKIRRNLRRNRNRWGPLFFETELERTDRHAPECPMSGIAPAMHQKKRTLGVSIPAMAKILNSAVRISCSLVSGGSSCSQSIAWVATVDEYSSPPFRIALIAKMASRSHGGFTAQDMQVLVESCRRRLMLCYAKKQASLTDVNDSGESVLDFIASVRLNPSTSESDNLAQVFRLLIALNIPATDADELAGNGYNYCGFENGKLVQLDVLRDFPEIAENLGFNPLSIAILREDEEEVQALVEKYPSYRMEANYCGQSPVHIAIQRGNFRILSLVIQGATADILNAAYDQNQYPIDLATDSSLHNPSRYEESLKACNGCKMLELLLESKSVLFQGTAAGALAYSDCQGAKKTIIRYLAMRRKELEHLAVSSLSSAEVQCLGLGRGWVLDQNAAKVQRYLEARSCHIPKHLMVYDEKYNTDIWWYEKWEDELSIYATIHDKELAEYSISLGFDAETAFVDLFRQIALIATGSYRSSLCPDYSSLPSYVGWMIERGANIARSTDVLFYCKGRERFRTRLEEFASILPKRLDILMPLREYHNIEYRWIYRAILRFLTFDALDLRHTCCGLWERPIPDAEEIEEIHQEDSARLQLLEDLLVEFEAGCGSNANLDPFIRDTWIPRMRAVNAELDSQKLTEEEFMKAEECGVEWIDRGDKVSPSSDIKDEVPEDLEYWLRKLDEIAIDPQRPLNAG